MPTGVSLEDPSFYRTISGISGRQIMEGNEISLIETGQATFEFMFRVLAGAKRSVNMEVYIFRDDVIGRAVTALLCDRARAGVPVNIIVDSFGARFMGRELPRLLAEAGVRIHYYHPISFLRYTRFMRRTHRKMLIVDGEIGLTGGFNISDEWFENGGGDSKKWRDLQVVVRGPAVFQAQSIFMEHWFELTAEVLSGEPYYPALPTRGTMACRFIGSSPASGSSALQQIYFLAISAARRYFWMENAYFVPDKNSVTLLCDAARRGVDVRLIVPGPTATDARAPVYAARNYYGPLMRCGVKIFEYRKQKLHSKFAIADGVWTTVGSTNFDNRSFKYHDEMNLNVYDAAFSAQVAAIFERDQADCRPVDPKKFKRRKLLPRFREWIFKLFEEQL